MTYKVITSHPWQDEERELFQQLQEEIVKAADILWQLDTSILLLDAAEEWREKSGTEGDALDAIEFFLCSWLRQHKPKVKTLNTVVNRAYELSRKLRSQSCNNR